MKSNINIGTKDVIWNYFATFLQLGNGLILLPFILHYFPAETFTIWTVFSTIIALTVLLDLGFNQSFARNISYVMSGAKELKSTGFDDVDVFSAEIDFHLFRGVIDSMKRFYRQISFILLVLLLTVGSYYIYSISQNYTGNKNEIYISWIILSLINAYSLYTFYYDALLQGKGLVKTAKQIQVAGQSVYLIVAIVLILLKFDLIAVVAAQVLSVVVRRTIAYFAVYTNEFKNNISVKSQFSTKEILKFIFPNAVKLGLVNIGNAIVTRSAVIIGALYLSYEEMASYGITIQIVWVLGSVGTVYFSTFIPKLIQLRAQKEEEEIKKIYIVSILFLMIIFLLGGAGLMIFGDYLLELIKSKTKLLPILYIFSLLIIQFLDNYRGMAEWVLSTKNEIPFFKASIFTGAGMLILILGFLNYTSIGVWSLIMAPAIAQNCYQNWKWPVVVINELKIRFEDFYTIFRTGFNKVRSLKI